MKRQNFIIGIDEVGRGSLAGPVTVAAILLRSSHARRLAMAAPKLTSLIRANGRITKLRAIPLRDSKKLSASNREAWFRYIKKMEDISYAVSHVQPKIVDKINISNAANLAAYRTLQKLLTTHYLLPTGSKIFLDGGLYMRNSIKKTSLLFKSRTITKGDEKVPAIALASIVAKVRRDALMKRLHKKHTRYGFNVHKGYGTKKHLRAIKKYGLSDVHRTSFC